MPLQRYAERCADRMNRLEAALDRVVAVCRAEPVVHEAYIFGSYAVGEIGPTSDLDVLIVRDTRLGVIDRAADLKLAARGDVPIDLVVVTPEEYMTTFHASSFGRTVLTSARQVYAA